MKLKGNYDQPYHFYLLGYAMLLTWNNETGNLELFNSYQCTHHRTYSPSHRCKQKLLLLQYSHSNTKICHQYWM